MKTQEMLGDHAHCCRPDTEAFENYVITEKHYVSSTLPFLQAVPAACTRRSHYDTARVYNGAHKPHKIWDPMLFDRKSVG